MKSICLRWDNNQLKCFELYLGTRSAIFLSNYVLIFGDSLNVHTSQSVSTPYKCWRRNTDTRRKLYFLTSPWGPSVHDNHLCIKAGL